MSVIMNVRCSLADDCHLCCSCKQQHIKTKACNKGCKLYARAKCVLFSKSVKKKICR